MTNTHALSSRIVAALDPDGTRWPNWWADLCPACGDDYILNSDNYSDTPCWCHGCHWEGERTELKQGRANVPNLAQPENLHLLLAVADSVGHTDLIADWNGRGHTCFIGITKDAHKGFATTRSLAVLAAVCAALGIDTTQETTHAAD